MKLLFAVKDNSKTLINNVNFLNNKNQISAYKKNLQYGSGGEAVVSNSVFKNEKNVFFIREF